VASRCWLTPSTQQLKRALERHPAWLWIAVAIAAVASCAMHAALLLALSPSPQ
jgi:hypothetical protein